MMLRFLSGCVCCLVVFCGVLWADVAQLEQPAKPVAQHDAVPATALQSLTQSLQAMHSMTAEFTQQVQDQEGTLLQQSSGHMAWQRSNHFKWTVTEPNQQIMVADGEWLWVYTPSLSQVSKQKLLHQAGTPASLLSGSVDSIGQQFAVSVEKQTQMTVYHLQPKDPQAPFSEIQLVMVDGKLSSMRFKDQLEQSTLFSFSSVAINKSLPSHMFAFIPPAKATVVDQTVGHS